MLVFVPPIIFMDYWFYAITIGIILIPFWIKSRWDVYRKALVEIENHKLVFFGEVLELHYENSKYSIDLSELSHINVNTKKGYIESIRLLFKDGNNVTLRKYQKMNAILKHLQSIVVVNIISYHRWFHKH